jgi:hypothetical protein
MTSDNYVFDLDNVSNVPNQPKSIYAGDVYGDQPFVTVTDDGVWIAGSTSQVMAVTEKYGVQLTGNISLSGNPQQIYLAGGYWTLNPLLLSCLPSTSVTPIPVLIPATPLVLSSQSGLTGCLTNLGSNGL